MRKQFAKRLQPTDAAYLAGLIDGESTITLSRRHANERRQVVVSVVSTEREILTWILVAVGTGKVTRKRTVSSRHAPSFTYSISNRQALDLLEQAAPHLRSYKRHRARLVLDRYVALTPRNGKYSPDLSDARAQFEREFLALKPSTLESQ
jgi:hypothetical protein